MRVSPFVIHHCLSLCAALVVATAAAGCSHDHTSTTTGDGSTATCAAETRALAYTPGMSLTGNSNVLKVQLVSSDPGPPLKGDNKWMIKVTDANSGAAVDGLKIDVVPRMPDHGHGTPIAVVVTPMGSGSYQLNPLNLFMAGLWQVTITLTTTDNKVDQTMFPFCIEG